MKNRTWKKAAACFLSAALTFSTFGAPLLSVHAEEQTESELNTDPDNALGTDGTELSDGTELPDESEIVNDTEFTDGTAKAVQDVQTMIDELPTVENVQGMSLEEQQAVYTQVQDAYDAYEALSDEEQVQLIGVEIFDSLFDFFNGMTNALAVVNNINYLDENGTQQTANNVTEITDTMTTLNTGWYVVNSDVTINDRIIINGAVHLILADKCKLVGKHGIRVLGSNSFTVYAQSTSDNMGILEAAGDYRAAGIGSEDESESAGTITISGGMVTSTGGAYAAGIGGGFGSSSSNIIINGGSIIATGGTAGIGGGTLYNNAGSYSGDITINGGSIIAKGNSGIGGGTVGTITINNGNIMAVGNSGGAGIGGGASGGTIMIKGGKIEAIGGSSYGTGGAGIGGGGGGDGGNITITGGMITTTGGNGGGEGSGRSGGAGIGGGGTNKSGGTGGIINISGGTIEATGGSGGGGNPVGGAGIGGGGARSNSGLAGGYGGDITISGGIITATGSGNAAGIGGGEHDGHIQITENTTFSTGINGTAVIFANSGNKSISDQSYKTNSLANGMIFENKTGAVYGSSFILDIDMTIPAYYQLEIPASTTLTIPANMMITNSGTILVKNEGTLNSEERVTNIDNGKIIYEAATPAFTVSQTASSITVTPTNYDLKYGEVQYQWNGGSWETNATLSDLKANSSHKVAVRYAGQGSYTQSETATQDNIETNKAAYTITIPAEATAGGESKHIAVNTDRPFDLGYGGTVNVTVSSGITNGNLTLTRQGASNTITSAMYVGNNPFTDTSQNVAAFTSKTDNPVAISFKKPEGVVPAGTYSGTVTFAISYSQ